jgi:hypothetical protein
MCPVHHDVIDADVESYSVARLLKLKEQREAVATEELPLSDADAKQFIANITGNTVANGSIIYSVNQSGGQIAHSITNIGPVQRTISEGAVAALVRKLRQLGPLAFEIEAVDGDAEASGLGHLLGDGLVASGWACRVFASSRFPRRITGLTVTGPPQSQPVMTLLEELRNAGLSPVFSAASSLDYVHILIGHQR